MTWGLGEAFAESLDGILQGQQDDTFDPVGITSVGWKAEQV